MDLAVFVGRMHPRHILAQTTCIAFTVATIGLLLSPAPASACSASPCEPLSELGGTAVQQVPANPGLLQSEASLEDGTVLDTVEVGHGFALWRPESPLPAGTRLRRGERVVEVAGGADTAPPTRPALEGGVIEESLGCNCSTDLTLLDVDPPDDDVASPDQLTYAVYTGRTPEEARTTAEPLRLVLAAEPDRIVMDHCGRVGEQEHWVTVSAIDLAGNESARSEPMAVRKGRGCALLSRAPSATLTWPALALLLIALRRGGSQAGQPA